ncbi:MAG: Stp1/IreP family PP2C-type Ser/Thr phosphatase [Lachnospiraceae bacterium]|nr:Stp1/IreP family PP2C-type Ser/Thr phosphatase [Lachnospiraceae bacterium]
MKTFSKSDIGKKRKVNQDSVFTSEVAVGGLPDLFIVADGMGGHAAGDFASKTAVETMVETIMGCDGSDPKDILAKGIAAANETVYRKSSEDKALEGMGTTLVASCVMDGILYVANVGDSRLYLLRDDEIRQVTMDHSLVEEMVRKGIIARESARNHPDKNKITRAVGVADTVEPDYFTVDLEDGDYVLMCTDGLTNMLEDSKIRTVISAARDIPDAAIKLVDTANARGGRDNISVVLIKYEK